MSKFNHDETGDDLDQTRRDEMLERVDEQFDSATPDEAALAAIRGQRNIVIDAQTAVNLAKNMPEAAIVTKDRDGQTFRYVPAVVIFHLADKIFRDRWSSKVVHREIVFQGLSNERGAGVAERRLTRVVAQCTVRVTVRDARNRKWSHEATGVSSGEASFDANPAGAYAKAVKGAETIARKNALGLFGRALGLHLKDADGMIERVRRDQRSRRAKGPAADAPVERAKSMRVAAIKAKRDDVIDVRDDTNASVHPAKGWTDFAEHFSGLVDRALSQEALDALRENNKKALKALAKDRSAADAAGLVHRAIEDRELHFKGQGESAPAADAAKAEPAAPGTPAAESAAELAGETQAHAEAEAEIEATHAVRAGLDGDGKIADAAAFAEAVVKAVKAADAETLKILQAVNGETIALLKPTTRKHINKKIRQREAELVRQEAAPKAA